MREQIVRAHQSPAAATTHSPTTRARARQNRTRIDQVASANNAMDLGDCIKSADGLPLSSSSSLWDALPDELVLDVFAAAGAKAVLLCSLASRRHHRLASDLGLWRRLYEARFGPPLHADFVQRGRDWRWLYRARACDGAAASATVGTIYSSTRAAGGHEVYHGDVADAMPHGYGLAMTFAAAPPPPPPQATTTAPSTPEQLYEGDFCRGERDGHGVLTLRNGKRHEGTFCANKANGPGVLTLPNGTRYDGWFVDDRPHGRGVHTWANGRRYEGTYATGKRHGRGVFMWSDGARYEGAYADGKRHGHGVSVWSDGVRYEGNYEDDKMHGHGVHTWPDGRRYEGTYAHGKKHGHGALAWPDGRRYEGGYAYGTCHGHGVFTWPDGRQYSGCYVRGKRTGYGTFDWPNGERHEGAYADDKRSGRGVWRFADSSLVKGRWSNSVLVDVETVEHAGSCTEHPCGACQYVRRCTLALSRVLPTITDLGLADADHGSSGGTNDD
ncbi:Morn repeat domain containing protein [Pandoravirus salinus]|uniref:Morn repeat domain containing protein n=1 Tax=Pandoravirus salinus TaxID=1349410 RepID=A0A291ATH5_9VIRU|nr:morn repeat domain [Pandoravirus salinus]ATE82183.1 Morn repeat domain containing protein [Pandoravirus salinus]